LALARDHRTACDWQNAVNNQQTVVDNFKAVRLYGSIKIYFKAYYFLQAMAKFKLAVVGQDVSSLVDCTEVLPPAAPPVTKPAS
jgi:manganese peroxidase